MMPVIFIGHGSPMNAIEDNIFTQNWQKIAKNIARPKAILAISAHWFIKGTHILAAAHPKMTYDMYGFPQALYDIVYDAPGALDTAARVKHLLGGVKTDNTWGYDHGTWSVLHKMYPQRDIPATQLSINALAPAKAHFAMGQALKPLRQEGVLILASGNIVHNLRMLDWDNPASGYGWADDFDSKIKSYILSNDFEKVVNYRELGQNAALAAPTPDHFYPLLYALGAAEAGEKIAVYNDARTMGSMSMTSYVIG